MSKLDRIVKTGQAASKQSRQTNSNTSRVAARPSRIVIIIRAGTLEPRLARAPAVVIHCAARAASLRVVHPSLFRGRRPRASGRSMGWSRGDDDRWVPPLNSSITVTSQLQRWQVASAVSVEGQSHHSPRRASQQAFGANWLPRRRDCASAQYDARAWAGLGDGGLDRARLRACHVRAYAVGESSGADLEHARLARVERAYAHRVALAEGAQTKVPIRVHRGFDANLRKVRSRSNPRVSEAAKRVAAHE